MNQRTVAGEIRLAIKNHIAAVATAEKEATE